MKSRIQKLTLGSALALCAGSIWHAAAFEGEVAKSGSPEEQAIRQSTEAFAKAYNAADAKAIANQFAADGEYIDEYKNVFKGREAIEREFAAFFKAQPGNKVQARVDSIRFVGGTMAIEEGTTILDSPGNAPEVESKYIAIHMKQGGGWKIAVARDLEADVTSPHERLRPLEWLIGDWVDESDDATVKTATRWSEDGNFILSDFHVEMKTGRTLKGTQRIGWDPSRNQIRSWVFDSQGGFADGVWTQAGKQWQIRLNGVTPEGEIASAINFYEQLDGKTVRWSVTHRVVGDEQQPDSSVIIVRQPPAAAADLQPAAGNAGGKR